MSRLFPVVLLLVASAFPAFADDDKAQLQKVLSDLSRRARQAFEAGDDERGLRLLRSRVHLGDRAEKLRALDQLATRLLHLDRKDRALDALRQRHRLGGRVDFSQLERHFGIRFPWFFGKTVETLRESLDESFEVQHDMVLEFYDRGSLRVDELFAAAPLQNQDDVSPPVGKHWRRLGWTFLRGERWGSASPQLGKYVRAPGRYAVAINIDGFRVVRPLHIPRFGVFVRTRGGDGLVMTHDHGGAPIAGVGLTLVDHRGRRRSLGSTSKSGLLRFAAPTAFAIVATHGGAVERHHVDGDYYRDRVTAWHRVHIATDRPIYRPGQQVRLRAVARLVGPDGRSVMPTAARTTVTIADPSGRVVHRTERPIDDQGALSSDYRLADEPTLGRWTVRVHLADARHADAGGHVDRKTGRLSARGVERTYASAHFTVAAYRKPEMTVRVHAVAPKAEGESTKVRIEARYLFGGPAAGAVVEWELQRQIGWSWSEHDDDGSIYELRPPFSDPLSWHYADRPDLAERVGYTFGENELDRGKGVLGPEGTLALELDLTSERDDDVWYADRSTFVIRATVRDASRLTASGETRVTLDDASDRAAAPRRLDVLAEKLFYRPGDTVRYQVRLARATGQPLAAQRVRVWLAVSEPDEDAWESVGVSATVTTDARGRATASLTLPDDLRGPVALCARHGSVRRGVRDKQFLHVLDERARQKPDPYESRAVVLTPERVCYRVGETARVALHTFNLETIRHALLIVEGDGIQLARLVPLSQQDHVLEIPLPPAAAPNVFVQVQLLSYEEEVAAGCELFVADPAERLHVQVRPGAPSRGPRQAQTVEVLTSRAGKPVAADVTLAIVDEAIYALAEDATPDLRATLSPLRELDYADRTSGSIAASSIHSGDFRTYRKWAARYRGDADSGGGGAGGALFDAPADDPGDAPGEGTFEGSAEPRRHFPDTLHWNPRVRTGADGRATVALKTADSLTTWRIDARAHAGAAYAAARSAFVTTAPLIARLSAPRFLVEGDRTTLAVVAHNRGKAPADVTVSLTVVGGATLDGAASRVVRIAAGGHARVDFSVSATSARPVTLVARAASPSAADAIETRVPVRPRGVAKTRAAAAGVAAPVWRATLEVPAGVARAQLELTVGTGALTAVQHALPYLARFPFGCCEQTMSRFLPAVVARQAITRLGLKRLKLPLDLDRAIDAGLRRLYGFQQRDGGWGWWRQGQSDPKMTAYVAYGLVLASRAGVDVNQDVLRRAALRLRAARPTPYGLLVRKLIVDDAELAALLGGDPTLEQQLRTAVGAASADALGVAQLVLAGATGLVDRLSLKTPDRADWKAVHRTAWTLRALHAVRPKDPAVARLRDWLLDQRQGPRWRTTWDTAQATMALIALLERDPGPPARAAVTVGGKAVALTDGAAVVRGLKPGALEVVVRRADDEPRALRVSAILEFHDRNATTRPSPRSKLVVQRWLQVLDTTRALPAKWWEKNTLRDPRWVDHDGSPLKAGQLLRIVATVRWADEETAPGDARVLIELPIPAGTEPVHEPPQKPEWWRDQWFVRREARDDRIVFAATRFGRGPLIYTLRATQPGRYRVLPAEAHDMYHTTTRGHSAATVVTIAPGDDR